MISCSEELGLTPRIKVQKTKKYAKKEVLMSMPVSNARRKLQI
jgi:hypothetical protein